MTYDTTIVYVVSVSVSVCTSVTYILVYMTSAVGLYIHIRQYMYCMYILVYTVSIYTHILHIHMTQYVSVSM